MWFFPLMQAKGKANWNGSHEHRHNASSWRAHATATLMFMNVRGRNQDELLPERPAECTECQLKKEGPLCANHGKGPT